MTSPAPKYFAVELSGGVATLLLDLPGESVNTLSPDVGAAHPRVRSVRTRLSTGMSTSCAQPARSQVHRLRTGPRTGRFELSGRDA